MQRYDIPGSPVFSEKAWKPLEVRQAVDAFLETLSDRLPRPSGTLFLNPDLSSDRPALLGGSVDLRLLVATIEALQARGYRHLLMGHTPSPAFQRLGIEPALRHRIHRLASRLGVRWIDLNRTTGEPFAVYGGKIHIPRVVLEADLIVNLGTVRTHPEAGLALSTWNFKGLVQTRDRPLVARELSRILPALVKRFENSITFLDALVVMEGEGPFDGTPVKLESLYAGSSPLAVDLLVARHLGFTPEETPHLWNALRHGDLPLEAQVYVESREVARRQLRRPQSQSPARGSTQLVTDWMRGAVRRRGHDTGWRHVARLLDLHPRVDPREDSLHGLQRHPARCGECVRCESFCPVGLKREEIGSQPAVSRCIECLYCFQVCDRGALTVRGEPGGLGALLNAGSVELRRL